METGERVAPIRAVTTVALPLAEAFETFVDEIGAWWPLPYTYAESRLETVCIEPRVGGSWFERDRDGLKRSWGRVRALEKDERIVLSFAVSPLRKEEPPERSSEVELRFSSLERNRTSLELEHRKLESHGEGADALHDRMLRAWPLVLTAYTRFCDARARRLSPQQPADSNAGGWSKPARCVAGLATIFVALSLVPAGAHLFELPNKLSLATDDYMRVQQIYRGWSLFGFVVLPAILLSLIHAAMLRRSAPRPFRWAVAGFLCMALGHVVFWMFTYPANALTENWARTPAAFDAVRLQWEMSHAVNALLSFAALTCLVVSILSKREADPVSDTAQRFGERGAARSE